jgi:hypothetical protein
VPKFEQESDRVSRPVRLMTGCPNAERQTSTYTTDPFVCYYYYSKPSLIRLQLIWMSDNPDQNMKN